MTEHRRVPRPIGRLIVLVAALALSIQAGFCALADGPMTYGNEFVSISVNNGNDGMGRFSLSTTGGDPASPRDDNKPLIYGGSDPWTSFTTVRIDGKDHIFGGQSSRRAGKSGAYPQSVSAPVRTDSGITASSSFDGVAVTQTLSLARSITTGNMDTLRIDYHAVNIGATSRSVGLRLVLDTMLGQNDGAPFRLPSGAVKQSLVLAGKSIPAFWQAFDSLNAPTIRAQGTLRGEGATVPDSLILADWGTLADNVWTSGISGGKGFMRKGEDEPDTATALVWNPVTLAPGEGRHFSTFYGLGGVTVSSSDGLLLGVTSPSEVVLDKVGAGSVPVIAYLENAKATEINNAVISLKLPKGASLQGGGQDRGIKSLPAFSGYQAAWNIIPPIGASGPIKYEVVVTAGKKVLNRVNRTVNVRVPPSLVVWVNGGPVPGFDGVVRIKATVKNSGDRRAEDAVISIRAPKDLEPARNESLTRNVGFLDPGASITVVWSFYTRLKGSAVVGVTATSTTARDASESRVIKLE